MRKTDKIPKIFRLSLIRWLNYNELKTTKISVLNYLLWIMNIHIYNRYTQKKYISGKIQNIYSEYISDKYIALSERSIYYTWKNMKSYENKKLKISPPTWNDEYELPDESYSNCKYSRFFPRCHQKTRSTDKLPT